MLTGRQLDELHDEALWHAAEQTDLFVEVDPNQKERIILALKKMGHVVGFLGDGVNDAPAMHAADTSLSVEQAVDVAREAADFVLLERGLDVIRRGIEEGRRTFANTLKYVLITTSANLGNMVSMAAASLFLPFLPLLGRPDPAEQLPVGHSGHRPRRRQRRSRAGRTPAPLGHPLHRPLHDRFRPPELGVRLSHVCGCFGSVFHAAPELFRTGWFVESLLTELAIALVVRTRRPFFRSRPGRAAGLDARPRMVTFAIPFLPFASLVGFVPLSPLLLATIAMVTLTYVAATELTKGWFYHYTTDV